MAEAEPDEILKQLTDLQNEGKDAFASFQKRVTAKTFTDPNDLANEMKDLFALFLDLAALTASAHTEHFEWAGGVDDELDSIREGMPPGSMLIASDAENLRQLLVTLRDNLRTPSSEPADQQLIQQIQARTVDVLAFVAEITADPEEEDEEDDDEDPESD